MDGDRAAKIIAKSARDDVDRTVGDLVTLFRTGSARQVRNPFTGQPMDFASVEAKLVAKHLEVAGLTKNQDFLTAIEQVLRQTATTPIFNFFTAYDGEGAFVEDLWIEMKTDQGHSVPHHLHEIMWSGDDGAEH